MTGFLWNPTLDWNWTRGHSKRTLLVTRERVWQKRHGGGGCSRNSDVKTIIFDIFYLLWYVICLNSHIVLKHLLLFHVIVCHFPVEGEIRKKSGRRWCSGEGQKSQTREMVEGGRGMRGVRVEGKETSLGTILIFMVWKSFQIYNKFRF